MQAVVALVLGRAGRLVLLDGPRRRGRRRGEPADPALLVQRGSGAAHRRAATGPPPWARSGILLLFTVAVGAARRAPGPDGRCGRERGRGLVRANLQRLLSDRSNYFFLVALPLLILFALGVAIGGTAEYRLGVVDEHPTDASRAVLQRMAAIDDVTIVPRVLTGGPA